MINYLNNISFIVNTDEIILQEGKRLLEGKGKEISEDKAFFILVLFLWAMLKGDSKEIYPTPESLSALLFPLPNEDIIEEIYSYLQSDLSEFENQNA